MLMAKWIVKDGKPVIKPQQTFSDESYKEFKEKTLRLSSVKDLTDADIDYLEEIKEKKKCLVTKQETKRI